jgi:hypothetical protein
MDVDTESKIINVLLARMFFAASRFMNWLDKNKQGVIFKPESALDNE